MGARAGKNNGDLEAGLNAHMQQPGIDYFDEAGNNVGLLQGLKCSSSADALLNLPLKQ